MDEKLLIKSNKDYAVKFQKISRILLFIALGIIIVVNMVYFLRWHVFGPIQSLIIASPVLLICIIFLIISHIINKCSISVSDKRVFGTATFGKRVDLPLDSISAIGVSMLKGITISTASGHISFKGIGNRDEIFDTISKLLIERQNNKGKAPIAEKKQEIPQSNADELKEYKELLDMGAITQEEFDAKKKQLLGL